MEAVSELGLEGQVCYEGGPSLKQLEAQGPRRRHGCCSRGQQAKGLWVRPPQVAELREKGKRSHNQSSKTALNLLRSL